MPVVDTSFLVALANAEDRHHKEALKLAGRPGPFTVPSVILQEYLLVVSQRLREREGGAPGAARGALEDLRRQPVFVVETDYDAEAAADLFQADASLSYADAVGIVLSRGRKDELWTFDARQKQVAAKR